ncbi:MAG: hypothetical protein NXH75_16180, partial [Halobacteriovoraceae bacterium]|nr:hypothetical protein [Halobacteriovoraceae bacterium]
NTFLSASKVKLESEIKNIKNELSLKQGDLASIDRKRDTLTLAVEEKKSVRDELLDRLSSLKGSQIVEDSEVSRLKMTLDEFSNEISQSSKEIEQLTKERSSLKSEKQELITKCESLKEKIKSIDSEIALLREDRQELAEQIRILQIEEKVAFEKAETKQMEKVELKEDVRSLYKDLGTIEKEKTQSIERVRALDYELDGARKRKTEVLSQLKSLKSDRDNLLEEIKAKSEAKRKFNKVLNQVVKGPLENAQKELSAKKAIFSSLEKEIQTLEGQIFEADEKVTNLIQEKENLNKDVQSLQGICSLKERKLLGLKESIELKESELDITENQIAELMEKSRLLDDQKMGLEKHLSEKDLQLKDLLQECWQREEEYVIKKIRKKRDETRLEVLEKETQIAHKRVKNLDLDR